MEGISIALLCTILGFIISFLTFQRNNKKDIENDTQERAEIKAKLGYISRGIDDIKLDNKARDKEMTEFRERLIIHEEKINNLEKRVERIEGDE